MLFSTSKALLLTAVLAATSPPFYPAPPPALLKRDETTPTLTDEECRRLRRAPHHLNDGNYTGLDTWRGHHIRVEHIEQAGQDWLSLLEHFEPDRTSSLDERQGFAIARRAYAKKWGVYPEEIFGGLKRRPSEHPRQSYSFQQSDFKAMGKEARSRLKAVKRLKLTDFAGPHTFGRLLISCLTQP